MRAFQYEKPDTLESAGAALLGGEGIKRISAGGTDLIGALRGKIHPEYAAKVVSLKGIAGIAGIKETPDGISIGAMTKLSEIERDPLVGKDYPALVQAAKTVASPQLRHMATLGGNICQEPRCWYYRYPDNKFDCMRKGGALCNAMYGNNKYHAIFGAAKVGDTPCSGECPNGTDIPGYFDRIRRGDLKGAAEILFSVNPLAAVTGRVCPHTCENECNRQEYEESVSIRDIERFMGDYILEHWQELIGEIPEEAGKKVAVVGAGPAGLTAAFYLRRAGYGVTVFDDNDKPGGMLVYGIPAYRLPKGVVEKIVNILKQIGVEFKQNVKIGKDISWAGLMKDFDAALYGAGAWGSAKIGCPGEDADGVISGIEFLFRAANKEDTGVGGKIVAVVGGGNTAMDACRSAVRLGAKKVYNFYRRTQLEMPADAEELFEGAEEGVDFKYLVAPIEVIKDEKGRVSKVKLQKMRLGEPDASGRRKPEPVKGETETVDVDVLIAAIGQNVDDDSLAEAASGAGVFAAGDADIGPATVVEAISSARKAAGEIDMYLGGSPAAEEKETGRQLTFDPGCVKGSARVKMQVKPVDERCAYDEDVAGARFEDIQREANRCFNCGCVAVSPSDMAPAIIALDGVIVTTGRKIPAGEFFKAGICSSTVLDEGEIVTEVRIPKPAKGSIQFYNKFRYRKSIDFPVIGLAGNFTFSDGKFKDAKLVASAVDPAPKVFAEVERFLSGKTPSGKLAEEAADIAVRDALPLAENRYKVQIMRALVRRAVSGCTNTP